MAIMDVDATFFLVMQRLNVTHSGNTDLPSTTTPLPIAPVVLGIWVCVWRDHEPLCNQKFRLHTPRILEELRGLTQNRY